MNGILSERVSSDERAWTVKGVARGFQVLKFQGIKEREDDKGEVEENEGTLAEWLLAEKGFDSWWWREEEKAVEGVAVLPVLRRWESKAGMVGQWSSPFVIILCLGRAGVCLCRGGMWNWRKDSEGVRRRVGEERK